MEIISLECRKPLNKEALERYRNIQLVDAGKVYGKGQIKFSCKQAEEAFERGDNFSADLFIETLLRASAQRQIKVALDKLGVKDSKNVIILAERLPGDFLKEYQCRENEEILKLTPDRYSELKRLYNITEKEISAVAGEDFEEKAMVLKEIIKERIALLNL